MQRRPKAPMNTRWEMKSFPCEWTSLCQHGFASSSNEYKK